MSRTVSTRLQTETHEKLCQRCNHLGVTVNDFLKECVTFGLDGYSEFDFGDKTESKDNMDTTDNERKPDILVQLLEELERRKKKDLQKIN